MQLIYSNPEETSIKVTLDESETLGNLAGPVEAYVPTDPMNADYAAILAQGLSVEPCPPAPLPPVEIPQPTIHEVEAQVQDIDARLSVLEGEVSQVKSVAMKSAS